VIKIHIDRDVGGYRPEKGQRDREGEEIEDRIYNAKVFDRTLVLDVALLILPPASTTLSLYSVISACPHGNPSEGLSVCRLGVNVTKPRHIEAGLFWRSEAFELVISICPGSHGQRLVVPSPHTSRVRRSRFARVCQIGKAERLSRHGASSL
jgi:hypothetical protein